MHTEAHAIQVHTQERAIQVHGILVHPSFLNCRGTSRCLAVGTSYSCTQLHSEGASQVHTQNVLSKCTPLNVLSKCTVYSCTLAS